MAVILYHKGSNIPEKFDVDHFQMALDAGTHVLSPAEQEVDDFAALKEEAKALGVKGYSRFKDVEKLKEAIEKVKSSFM